MIMKLLSNYHILKAISLNKELNKFFKKYGFNAYKYRQNRFKNI